MNPTIPNHVIRDALAEDEPAALSRTTLPAAAWVRIGECDNLWARYRGALPTRLMPLVTAQAICISSLTRRRIAKSVAALKQLLFTP
jgi:hypothetical protein